MPEVKAPIMDDAGTPPATPPATPTPAPHAKSEPPTNQLPVAAISASPETTGVLGMPPPAERALPQVVVHDLNLAADTDVAVVLRALARAGDQNVLISKGVEGKINFSFNNVPWDQAFKGVLASAGLTYAWEGDILRVMTLDDMKRDLDLRRIEHERKTVQAGIRKVEPLVLEIIRVRYTNAKKLGDSLKVLLGVGGTGDDKAAATPGDVSRASVTVDEDNNTIVVHAVSEDVAKARTVAAQLDRPRLQVQIEARIVEANRTTARELGIQWGGVRSAVDGGYMYTASAGADRPWAVNFPAKLQDDIGFTLGLVSERFGGGEVLNVQLSMLQQDGKINVLSSPSITTLDNEPATIESGEERAYKQTTSAGDAQNFTVQWKKAVLRLEVTPHIIDDTHLKLEVQANKDSFDETKPQSSGEFPVNTKKAKTTILLRNGQTTVIGGLSQETRSEGESGLPGLKDLPLIGTLFKSRRKANAMDEVLIFITPRILSHDPGDRS
jgi:type IV pilus assembly protein PilQ